MSDQIILSLTQRAYGQATIVNFDHVITIVDELEPSRHGKGQEPIEPHRVIGAIVDTVSGSFRITETVADIAEQFRQMAEQRELQARIEQETP